MKNKIGFLLLLLVFGGSVVTQSQLTTGSNLKPLFISLSTGGAEYFQTIVDEGLKVPASVFAAALGGVLSVDYTEQLKTITVPTVIFWGDKDAFCLASDQDRLVNNISHAKKLVYHETGHALHWEKPQRFVTDLSDFLDKLDSKRGYY